MQKKDKNEEEDNRFARPDSKQAIFMNAQKKRKKRKKAEAEE